MQNIVILAVLVLVLGLSISYIIKAKKSGVKCIGCPSGKECGCGCDSCNSHNE